MKTNTRNALIAFPIAFACIAALTLAGIYATYWRGDPDSRDAPVVEEMRYCYNEGCKLRGELLVSLQAETWDQDDSIATLNAIMDSTYMELIERRAGGFALAWYGDYCKDSIASLNAALFLRRSDPAYWLGKKDMLEDVNRQIILSEGKRLCNVLFPGVGTLFFARCAGLQHKIDSLNAALADKCRFWLYLDSTVVDGVTYIYRRDKQVIIDPCAGTVSIAAVDSLFVWYCFGGGVTRYHITRESWQRLTEGSR